MKRKDTYLHTRNLKFFIVINIQNFASPFKDGSSMVLQNAVILPYHYLVSQHSRPESLYMITK